MKKEVVLTSLEEDLKPYGITVNPELLEDDSLSVGGKVKATVDGKELEGKIVSIKDDKAEVDFDGEKKSLALSSLKKA